MWLYTFTFDCAKAIEPAGNLESNIELKCFAAELKLPGTYLQSYEKRF
jgi:hypothetical protein